MVDSAISIENLYAPELPIGLYAVAYEITADSSDNNSDNFDGDFFEVTDLLFAQTAHRLHLALPQVETGP